MLCRWNKKDMNLRWKDLRVCILAIVKKIVRKKQILYSKTRRDFLFGYFLPVLLTIDLDERLTPGFGVS